MQCSSRLSIMTLAVQTQYRARKLFNIRLYATLCFNYFRWHRRIFSYGSVFELLIFSMLTLQVAT